MAFADPQSVTIDGATASLGRIFSSESVGTFVSADTNLRLEIGPRKLSNGRTSRSAALRNTKITQDPLVSTTNVRVSDTIRLVIDRPVNGYTDAEVVKQVTGFIAWLTASSNANLIKLVAGEN